MARFGDRGERERYMDSLERKMGHQASTQKLWWQRVFGG